MHGLSLGGFKFQSDASPPCPPENIAARPYELAYQHNTRTRLYRSSAEERYNFGISSYIREGGK